jgi:hypothetical protein
MEMLPVGGESASLVAGEMRWYRGRKLPFVLMDGRLFVI